jgi:hypothetical protein
MDGVGLAARLRELDTTVSVRARQRFRIPPVVAVAIGSGAVQLIFSVAFLATQGWHWVLIYGWCATGGYVLLVYLTQMASRSVRHAELRARQRLLRLRTAAHVVLLVGIGSSVVVTVAGHPWTGVIIVVVAGATAAAALLWCAMAFSRC